MAEHSTVFSGPESQEALVADRQRTWHAFTGATTGAVILAVIILVLMGAFL
ncbi:MAG: aa3-type cytochrome c oxidase subunit IV [Rhodospirillales bacterium]|nr:aa3-type cytochrome c oxidase subunit IV [Rhodospirillales bacterium]MBN8898259.1 aa3-type cytochrome c oxidase subunit IV [Rhodospirillales bacterium]MBN8905823.1 aa3-type cytochrome c oxidase subunit IV [Rhodospirillales bacterium]